MRTLRALSSKVSTLAWFLSRPALYPELGRRILSGAVSTQRTERLRAEERRSGLDWCERVAVPMSALAEDLGTGVVEEAQIERLRSEVAEARSRVANVPVVMGGEGHLEVLFRLLLSGRYVSVLETGVAYGWSSLALLLALEIRGVGTLVSVDMPYPKRANEPWVGVAVPPSLRHRWTLIRLPDRDGLPRALRRLKGRVDLFHYDSDKTSSGRTYAYRSVWPALSPGGCLVSDDIEDNLAFRDFAERTGAPFWVVRKKEANYAGIIRKPYR